MLVVLPNAFGDAATNMAIDAALLETLPSGVVTFRHYGWTEPAITFGYSQRHLEVGEHVPDGVVLCRRMTGGGIVDHRNDWTYALVIDRQAPPSALSSTDLYARVHSAIAEALSQQGLATQLAPCPRKCDDSPGKTAGPDKCFVQPVMNDVLDRDGRKIAGAAMKRTRKGLLLQGSVDRSALPASLDFRVCSERLADQLEQSLEIPRHQPEDLRPFFQSSVIEREKAKFAGTEWTTRR
jgi:lipoate-protein ligase A